MTDKEIENMAYWAARAVLYARWKEADFKSNGFHEGDVDRMAEIVEAECRKWLDRSVLNEA